MANSFPHHRLVGAFAVGMVALLLAGCARPVGDLGRAQPNFVNDVALPAAGRPASAFNLSDEEQRMRDVIWRFLNSGRSHDWFADVAAELHRTGISRRPAGHAPVDRYYNRLHASPYQSSSVRYGALAGDVEADLATLPDSFATICAVQQVERQRVVAAANLPDVGSAARATIAARGADNQDQIDWFVHAVRYRYDAYNYALDHLLVETPDDQAKAVDAELADLGQGVGRAERGAFCDHVDLVSPHRPTAPAVPSRFVVGGKGFGPAGPATAPVIPNSGS